MDKCSTPSCSSCGPRWRLLLLLAPVLVMVALLGRSRESRETAESDVAQPAGQSAVEAGKTVSVAIDFGDGRQSMGRSLRAGMTVRDALSAAGDSSGGVKFAQQGTGESAFLTEIDGVTNEGAGGRNWTYAINGKFGDRSFAIYPLSPGDEVLWTFAKPK